MHARRRASFVLIVAALAVAGVIVAGPAGGTDHCPEGTIWLDPVCVPDTGSSTTTASTTTTTASTTTTTASTTTTTASTTTTAASATTTVEPVASTTTTTRPTTTTTRPTTTTTRPTTTTTRPTTTSEATTSTTQAPTSTVAPTTTPTTIRPAEDFSEATEEEEESTTTSAAPPPSIVKPAPPSVDIVAGETVQVPVESDDVFDPEVDPEVTLSTSGDDATTVQAIVTATVDEDGNLVIEVEVPEDTPESIITVTITAVDSRGVSRTIVYLFPVKPAPSTSSTVEGPRAAAVGGAAASNGVRWSDLPVVPAAEVPTIVKAIQSAIPDDAAERALLVELAAAPESVLTLDGDVASGTLAVSVRPLGDESAAAGHRLAAALAVGLAAIGLISLRRRSPSTLLTAPR